VVAGAGAIKGPSSGLVEIYRNRNESWWTRTLFRTIFRIFLLLAWLAVWQAIPELNLVSRVTLPPPSEVVDNFIGVIDSSFMERFWVTTQETFGGFGIGAGSALVVATLMTLFPFLRFLLTDYILALQALPKVLLIPVLLSAFGFGMQSIIVLAALIVFFPVYVNTMVGMNTVGRDEVKLMQTLKANRFQRLYYMQIPTGMPTIFVGLKNGITNALIAATIGEFLGSDNGLGNLIVLWSASSRFADVFGIIIILTFMTIVLFYAMDLLGRKVAFWAPRN
jgi:NitT/TauT family transport system permease protein